MMMVHLKPHQFSEHAEAGSKTNKQRNKGVTINITKKTFVFLPLQSQKLEDKKQKKTKVKVTKVLISNSFFSERERSSLLF